MPPSDIFNVNRNADQTDAFNYAALRWHVEILGRVLMNVPQYVLLEKARVTTTSSGRKDKGSSELETIEKTLARLWNNIGTYLQMRPFMISYRRFMAVDTRAAHLDRSHAKAVIQQLVMRIQYQRKIKI